MKSMHPEPQQELEDLARRLGEYGYRFRRAPFFAAVGIQIYTPPVAHDEIAVIESSVFVYRRDQHWEARVTQHGGPHWVRQVENIERLEAVAMEALRSKARPPSGEWTVEAEWTE